MVIHGVWKCWMRGRRREEDRGRKEMERGEEKKWMEERASTRTHALRARADGLFRELHARVVCSSAQIGLCLRPNFRTVQA